MTAAGPRGWVSAHLFHYGDLDALIGAVVAPVVRAVGAREHFFLRYWEGGQHVRLRIRPPGAGERARVRDLIDRTAAAYFAEHPSSPPIDADTYRAFAAVVARGERLERYDDRLHPTDSVEYIAYRPEHSAYGDDAYIAAVERHFTDSSVLALRVLGAGTPPGRRAAIGLAALTLTLAVCEPDLAAAATRLAAAEDPGGWPGEDDYRRRRDALREQTRGLWDLAGRATAGADGGADVLAAWCVSMRELRDTLDPLHAAGRCRPSNPGSPHVFLAMALPQRRRTVPAILLRCAHLFHNRLGLTLDVERHLSYLLARTLVDLADPGRQP